MKKLHTLGFIALVLLCCSFTGTAQNGKFSIKSHISGFEENTPVLLIDAETNGIRDTAFVKNNRFEFSGETFKEPKNFALYIPLENNVKYTMLFMADEDVSVEGNIDDFPNNLVVKGSAHHTLKANYDKRTAKHDEKMNQNRNKMLEMQQQNLWNDSLQRAYIGENGILTKINESRTDEEKRFITDNLNTYYGLQILFYKKSFYTDKELKKVFSKFSKELQSTKNGKAIQAYIDNPEIKKGKKYIDFEALDKNGNTKKLSDFFDGKKYVLIDFSTPSCQNSMNAVPMLQHLNKEYTDKLNVVTFYVDEKKEHFEYFSNPEINSWEFLWTEKGREGFPSVRYRINATPTYYLFAPNGKLIEKWSGFHQGYYDATQTKIEKLIGVK